LTPLVALVVLAATPTIEHASHDDCAIIVAVGKAELGWSAQSAGDWPFFLVYDLPGGGTYVEDCPWRALGVAPPVTGSHASIKGSAIMRPEYGPSRATATAKVSATMRGRDIDGRTLPPYLEDRVCKLERRDGGWKVIACDTTAVT